MRRIHFFIIGPKVDRSYASGFAVSHVEYHDMRVVCGLQIPHNECARVHYFGFAGYVWRVSQLPKCDILRDFEFVAMLCCTGYFSGGQVQGVVLFKRGIFDCIFPMVAGQSAVVEGCPYCVHDGSVDSFRNLIFLGRVGDSGAMVYTTCLLHCRVREVLLRVFRVQIAWLVALSIVEVG